MKRKIVRHGPSSLTISLPMKWVKKNNLTSGMEIEVIEDYNKLILTTDNEISHKAISIDLSDSGKMLNRVVGAIYKAGYDHAKIKYKSTNEFYLIQSDIERTAHGFEILKYSPTDMEVKSVFEQNPNEFTSVLKRLLYVVKNIGSEIYDVMKSNDKNSLDMIIMQDKSVDRHANFCRRLINKGTKIEYESPACVYYVCEEVEIIGDMYKDLAVLIRDNEIKILPEYLEIMNEINELFDFMIRLFYNFNRQKIEDLDQFEKTLNEKFDKLSEMKNIDVKLYSQLYMLYKTIFELKGAYFTLFLK